MAKKFLFTISHATSSPLEAIGILKIASNMKAFDDDAEIAIFLLGEGAQLAKKGVAATISMELEGTTANVGEMLEMAHRDRHQGLRLPRLHARREAGGSRSRASRSSPAPTSGS